MLEVIQLRRLSLLLVLGLMVISLVGCNENEAETRERILPDGSTAIIDEAGKVASEGLSPGDVSDETVSEKTAVRISKNALHRSDKQPPEKSELLKIQGDVTNSTDQAELATAINTLHEIHMYFESGFVYVSGSWIRNLSDPDSPGWVFWERTGTIEIPGYTEKVDNQRSGDTYIQWLEDVKQVFTDSELSNDITTVQKLIKYAVDNHDIKGLWYAHQVIHDIDYWILNYPIEFQAGRPAPPDWSGVNCYFGVTRTLEGSYPPEIEELLQD